MQKVRTTFSILMILFAAHFSELSANAAAISVPAGTRVPIIVPNTISSNSVKTSDSLNVTLAEDVMIDNQTVFRKGGKATIAVQKAQPNGNFGRPGKLELNGGMVFDVIGDAHPVNLAYSTKGRSRRAFSVTMTVLSIPLILFWVGLITLPIAIMTSGKEARVGEGLILDGITTAPFEVAIP
jgi:hypothetical protein